MTPVELLGYEVRGFFALLVAMLAYRMLTRQISLRGLFSDKTRGRAGGTSPERVQLFLATLAMAAQYIGEVLHSSGPTLPNVSAQWLTVFGASSGIYASVKTARALYAGAGKGE